MNRPTMADLAKASGVSPSTIDRVLNGRETVRDATAQRVLEAAERIGFYATPLLRLRLKSSAPKRTFGFLLQQQGYSFYRKLAAALTEATARVQTLQARAVVQHMDDLSPRVVADALVEMGQSCDSVALVAADHPLISTAIETLRGRGVSVVALVTDLTAGSRSAYAGLDNRKVGRTAAWFSGNFLPRPASMAILVGSHRYLCQESCESGFRSWMRENAPDIRILEPLVTMENELYAYENVLALLKRNPDLGGIYVAGGGVEGVLQALEEEDPQMRIATVCHDLTDITRGALSMGRVKAVLSHPLELLATSAVEQMVRFSTERTVPETPQQTIVPFEIFTPENI